ncbi:hypothetical protein J4727_19720 [Providencia rettgeri]|uniref:Uncharacterized protein n=1 Tax=Providencia rettgeri TaxID=587 RepID=A0A939SPM3_PRORE|nr:hypothetical protein [Providencia rettgeri]
MDELCVINLLSFVLLHYFLYAATSAVEDRMSATNSQKQPHTRLLTEMSVLITIIG